MSDDPFEPEGYPEHDTDWRTELTDCRIEVTEALSGYGGAVQAAVLSELLSTKVEAQAEEQFSREWHREHDDG